MQHIFALWHTQHFGEGNCRKWP